MPLTSLSGGFWRTLIEYGDPANAVDGLACRVAR